MTYQPHEEQLIHDAIVYATECHKGQYRKGTAIPYITHPVSVMKKLAEYGLAPEYLAAGVLHDVVEDTPATLEDIETRFGSMVATLVMHASEQERIADSSISIPWRQRKQATIEHILHEPVTEHLWVPLSDKLDNVQAIRNDYEKLGDALWSRFNAGKDDQAWYYGSMADAFVQRGTMSHPAFLAMANEFAQLVKLVFADRQRSFIYSQLERNDS